MPILASLQGQPGREYTYIRYSVWHNVRVATQAASATIHYILLGCSDVERHSEIRRLCTAAVYNRIVGAVRAAEELCCPATSADLENRSHVIGAPCTVGFRISLDFRQPV